MNTKSKSPVWVGLAMLLGIAAGCIIHTGMPDRSAATEIAQHVSLFSEVFLRLIRMVVGPLIFSTLVTGIAQMGDARAIARVFAKTMAWFISASLVSLLLGLVFADLLKPGDNLALALPDAHGQVNAIASDFTIRSFVEHLVPRSFTEAMATNEILQIVAFSILFGVGLAALGDRGKVLLAAIEQLSLVMLEITGYVMKLAPLAVLGAMTATVATNGTAILATFAVFMGEFYITLSLLWLLLTAAGLLFLGRRVFSLLVLIKDAFILSFSTASSEAAYPQILQALDRFGVKRRISSFVMPMGYSFNLDGSMLYCAFASLFIAQAYKVHLSLGTQVTMLLVLMLTSKGMAGVPRASLVVIAATLSQFGIPESGVLLILGVDTFLDMGRSATNAVGNSIASAVVARWEGELLAQPEAASEQTPDIDNTDAPDPVQAAACSGKLPGSLRSVTDTAAVQ